jgi:hypothetical protein
VTGDVAGIADVDCNIVTGVVAGDVVLVAEVGLVIMVVVDIPAGGGETEEACTVLLEPITTVYVLLTLGSVPVVLGVVFIVEGEPTDITMRVVLIPSEGELWPVCDVVGVLDVLNRGKVEVLGEVGAAVSDDVAVVRSTLLPVAAEPILELLDVVNTAPFEELVLVVGIGVYAAVAGPPEVAAPTLLTFHTFEFATYSLMTLFR